MSVALSFCPSLAATAPAPRARPVAAKGITLFAAAAALAGAAAFATIPSASAPLAASAPFAAATLVGPGTSSAALLSAAESMRARLLDVPGVGAVSLRGLQPGGLEVDYAASRLARLGLTPADLAAALPVQTDRSAPGRLAIQQEAAGSGPQPIADRPVRAGGLLFRVGDVATVARTALPNPVAAPGQDGRPAVDLLVTPAPGADGSLARVVSASLAQAALPAGTQLR